ncbi:hypothetical protein [Polaromonas sp. YR568]|uniref:hypothetical protein n=1 Tax=Polaromonas sp. YR568 TaxID=1855301 RepID=UPI0031382889
MKLNLSSSTLAGSFAILAGAVWLPFLYVYLFTSVPIHATAWGAAIDQIAFDFSLDGPSRTLMAVWYAMPIVWFVLAALLFSVSRLRYFTVLVLVGVTTTVALISSVMFGWGTAFLFGLPVWFGVVHARGMKRSSAAQA